MFRAMSRAERQEIPEPELALDIKGERDEQGSEGSRG